MRLKVVVAIALLLAVPLAAGAGAADESVDWGAPFLVSTNSFTFGQAPDWSPDGTRVLYHDDYPANPGQQLYTSRLDGSDRRCITCGQDAPNMVAHWRPQGDAILFHSWGGHQFTI